MLIKTTWVIGGETCLSTKSARMSRVSAMHSAWWAFVISPRVEAEQLKIDPLLVMIAVLVGGVLLGATGALVAVPFAAMLQVLYDEVFVPWRLAQIEAQE